MAHGVEVRVPLLDQDLVALAARLPDGMKQRGRTGHVGIQEGDGTVSAPRCD